MMNSSSLNQENPASGPKISNTRRPLQRLSINSTSAKSPTRKKQSATKPKMTAAFKPKMEPQEKLSVLSENTSQWPTVKETRTPSIDSDCENRPSIFRERADVDDTEEDMFVLKRANPVYDSDDDEEEYCTPPKRQRTNQVLQWGEQVNFGSHGFSIRL